MAFISEAREDLRHNWKMVACLEKEDCEIVMQALGPLVGRYLKSYEYYKDIRDGGEATSKQLDKLVEAEEKFERIINIRNTIVNFVKR